MNLHKLFSKFKIFVSIDDDDDDDDDDDIDDPFDDDGKFKKLITLIIINLILSVSSLMLKHKK